METIKNLLKPGAKHDDETLYDNGHTDANKGKVAGEGSHFGHQHNDSGVGGIASPTSSTNPTSGLTGASATKTADPAIASSSTNPSSGLAASSVNKISEPAATNIPVASSTAGHTTTAQQTSLPDRSSEAPIGQAVTTEGATRAFPLSGTGTGSTATPHASSEHTTAAGTLPAAATAATGASHAHPSNTPIASTSTSSTLPASSTGVNQGPSTISAGQISSANADRIISPTHPADDKCVDTLHGGSHVTQIARQIDPCYENEGVTGTTSTTSSSHPATLDPAAGSRSVALAPGTTGHSTTTTTPVTQAAGTTGTHGSAVTGTERSTTQDASHHSGAVPAAAVAGAGIGAVGAHTVQSHHSSGIQGASNSAPTASTVPAATSSGLAGTSVGGTAGAAHPYSEKAVDPRIDSAGHQAPAGTYGATAGTQSTVPGYSTLDPAADRAVHQHGVADSTASQRANPVSQTQDHTARNAAMGGVAGAGAGAVAGHEFSKKDAEHATKEQKKAEEHAQKEQEKEQKKHEKEVEKHNKEVEKHNKEIEKEQKHHEKELEKHNKEVEKHNKEVEKEQAKEQKEIEKHNKEVEKQEAKEQKQAEKEAEKERKEREKAEKPGLIDRLLHRDGSQQDKHHTEEAAGAGAAAGAGGAAVHEHEKHERNKLQKDPPAGYVVPGTRYGNGHDEHLTHGTTPQSQTQTAVPVVGSHQQTTTPAAATTVPTTTTTTQHTIAPQTVDPSVSTQHNTAPVGASTIPATLTHQPAPQAAYAAPVAGSAAAASHLDQGYTGPNTMASKSAALDPAHATHGGYASTVTGGTGTTQLAHGTTTQIPTEGMVPGHAGNIDGLTTDTHYVDGPKAGTGKYADQVTGGTGTTQLAQGQHDEVGEPRQGVIGKIEGALGLK